MLLRCKAGWVVGGSASAICILHTRLRYTTIKVQQPVGVGVGLGVGVGVRFGF